MHSMSAESAAVFLVLGAVAAYVAVRSERSSVHWLLLSLIV